MKKIVLILLAIVLCVFLTTDFTYAKSNDADIEFEDIPVGHWAFEDIHYIFNSDIVKDIKEKNFLPDKHVTLEEIVNYLAIFNSLDVKAEQNLSSDITSGDLIETVKNYFSGYQSTDENSLLNPEEKVSREDFIAAVVNIVGLKSNNLNNAKGLIKRFTDKDLITPSLHDYIEAAVENNLVQGYENSTLRPKSNITRAEAVTILCRALKFQEDNIDLGDWEYKIDSTEIFHFYNYPSDCLRGKAKLRWSPSLNEAEFKAVIEVGENLEVIKYEVILEEVISLSEDDIEGLFTIKKDGNILLDKSKGRFYGLRGGTRDIFKMMMENNRDWDFVASVDGYEEEELDNIISGNPIFYKENEEITEGDSIEGECQVWVNTDKQEPGFEATILADGQKHVLKLIKPNKSKNDSIEGIFEYTKDGKSKEIMGKVYGLESGTENYFKFYSEEAQIVIHFLIKE